MSAGDYAKKILAAKTREKRIELLSQVPKHLRETVKQMVEIEFNKRNKKHG